MDRSNWIFKLFLVGTTECKTYPLFKDLINFHTANRALPFDQIDHKDQTQNPDLDFCFQLTWW